jgi:hypothetical protein
LRESVFEADQCEELGRPARRIFHTVEVLMKLIDIVTSIFITFGGFTIDRWMSGIDNTLDEGNLNVVLIDL